MPFVDEQIRWTADGKPVAIGLTRARSGPSLLMLPALSSISTRTEMRPLQERLAASFATVAIDWPGFGTLPRPTRAQLAKRCTPCDYGIRSTWPG